MAACVKAAAFAMLLRVIGEGVGPAIVHWHPVLWWLAALTMVVGNVVALSQRTLKRLLAFSGIAHAGYLLVAVLAFSDASGPAIVFYLFVYTLATLGAFAVLGIVSEGHEGSPTREDVAGLWHVRPGLAAVLAVCLLAFLGFPVAGGAGFFAKWYVLQAALSSPTPLLVLVVILVLASVVSAGYYLQVIAAMFNQPRPDGAVMPVQTPLLSGIVMVGSVVLLLAFGVYPAPVAQLAANATLEATPPADRRAPTATNAAEPGDTTRNSPPEAVAITR
jgi:NADH-quinone oxidoreductase subunit N